MGKKERGSARDCDLLAAASAGNEEFSAEELKEKRNHLESLRRQIREGTYRPAIGEIAINLLRSGNAG